MLGFLIALPKIAAEEKTSVIVFVALGSRGSPAVRRDSADDHALHAVPRRPGGGAIWAVLHRGGGAEPDGARPARPYRHMPLPRGCRPPLPRGRLWACHRPPAAVRCGAAQRHRLPKLRLQQLAVAPPLSVRLDL